MIQLSVAIITLNEEKKIGQCLGSVREIADEIIVVDSFSTDRTREICEEFGARFIQNPFQGHIEQKNFAFSQCKGDYILSLDADEALDCELQESLKKLKASPEAQAYSFNRLTNYAGQWIHHCGWYPDTKLRFVKNKTAKWEGTNPHDILVYSGDEKVVHLKGDILHYSYDSIEDHVQQTNKFTSINAQFAFQKGIRSNWFKVITRGPLKFLRDYFWKKGFLDGRLGFVICTINALSAFLKYAKILELQKVKAGN